MVFTKDDLAVIVTCFTEKGWTGTQIAKEFSNKKWNNYQSISNVGFLQSIVTLALPTTLRKAAEHLWPRWQRTIWLSLNSFVRNSQQPASSRTYHWRVTEIGTASAEEAQPPCVQENANISSGCLVTDKAVQLKPDFLSVLLWKTFPPVVVPLWLS